MKCLICNKYFRHLGSHIWHKHKITAKEYKEEFGLPYNMALIEDEIKIKKRIAFEKDKKKYLQNLSTKKALKYRFKKGKSGYRRVSATEKEKIIKRIKNVNKKRKKFQTCPVCRMKVKHLESHIFNKHGLLIVDKKKFKNK